MHCYYNPFLFLNLQNWEPNLWLIQAVNSWGEHKAKSESLLSGSELRLSSVFWCSLHQLLISSHVILICFRPLASLNQEELIAVMNPKLEKNTKNKIKNFCPWGEMLHFEALAQSGFKSGIMKCTSISTTSFTRKKKNPTKYFINRK